MKLDQTFHLFFGRFNGFLKVASLASSTVFV
jgi:hypothetical protein